MKSERLDVFAAAAIITILIMGIIAIVGSGSCYLKTHAMGLTGKYRPIAGCIVTTKKGDHIPLDKYRVIE